MNAPTQDDIPADLLDQLGDEWTVKADMKRLEMWHDEYGHVVVTDDGDNLSIKSWADSDSGERAQAVDTDAVESQETAATRAAEFALELERDERDDELSVLARIPIVDRLFR